MKICILFVEVVVLTVVARACTTPSIVSLCTGARNVSADLWSLCCFDE